MKKFLIILILVFVCSNFSYSQKETSLQEYSRVSYKVVTNGEVVSAVCNSKTVPSVKSILKCLNINQEKNLPGFTVSFYYTGCTTIYDIVSNGTPQNIIRDPNDQNKIHAVFMSAPWGDGPTFPNRKTKYYYSTSGGVNWTFVADVPSIRSGFPVICLAANGNELISNHNTNITNTLMSHFYYDASPGSGSFTQLYPSAINVYQWPKTVTTNSITLTNKFVNVSGAAAYDSCFWVAGTSLGPSPGNFSPWHQFIAGTGGIYSIAKGIDGRIGILYHNSDEMVEANFCDLYFMESTDNGTTFGTPTKIYDANISPTGDSLGHLNGMQLIYQGNVPKVVFEVCKIAPYLNSLIFFPNNGRNHIRFWSTSLPGSDPNRSIKIADTGSVGYHPYISTGSNNDQLTCICRPTIGASLTGNYLYVAFSVPSNYVGGSTDTVSFMDMYLMYSSNGGLNWFTPLKINPVSPIKDWVSPCISISNYNNASSYSINLTVLSDSIPGSYYSHFDNGQSNAKHYFIRADPIVGINKIESEIPNGFKLYQNYPNPFNPSTIIRFQIPKLSSPHALGGDLITLKVYDILGKEVATLVNEKLSPGTYETQFSINSMTNNQLSSGIYFYKLSTESFIDIKRMVLIK